MSRKPQIPNPDARYPENIKDMLREYDEAIEREQLARVEADSLAEDLRNHGVPNIELLEESERVRSQLAEDMGQS